MGIVRKLKDAARWVENVVAEEAPRPKPAERKAAPPEKKPDDAKLVRGLGRRIAAASLLAVTLGSAALGLTGCKIPGQPEPRPPYTEDADKPDYQCGYDGNQRCPTTPPPVRASCDEPASWCDTAVQR